MPADSITVSSIWVFPIKSARGTQLTEATYGETGLEYDRHWMIVEEKTHQFLTARNIGRMILLHPTLDIPTSTLSLHIPAYSTFPASTHSIPLVAPSSAEYLTDLKIWSSPPLDGYVVGSPALTEALSNFMGRPVLLVQKGVERREAGPEEGWVGNLPGLKLEYDDVSPLSWADQFPILVVNEASLKEVEKRTIADERVDKARWKEGGHGLEVERFRGNVVLSGAEEWEEDGWAELSFGGEGREDVLYVASRCARCMLPNVDPDTGVRDKVVPDKILRPYREGTYSLYPQKTCFGVQCVPKPSKGILRVGDKVRVVATFPKTSEGGFDRPEDHLV